MKSKIAIVASFLKDATLVWKYPRKTKALIFDARTGFPLLDVIDPQHTGLMYHATETLNVWIALRCVGSGKLSLQDYVKHYIRAVDPSVVITLTDNAISFYRLKSEFPHITFIAHQSSVRGENRDLFDDLKSHTQLRCDYIFVFNPNIGERYRRHIDAEIISAGSLISNFLPESPPRENRDLVLISEFRKTNPGHSRINLTHKSGRPVTYEDLYRHERMVVPFLADYCLLRGLNFKICGTKAHSYSEEEAFYRKILGDRKYQYIPRTSWYSNYQVVFDAWYVVFTNSTLGHECLGRGKRVACLSARGAEFVESADYKFGWPLALPDSGPFWTNHSDTDEFTRVLDYVTTVGDAEWTETWRKYGPDQMDYDPGNTRLKALLERLGMPTRNEPSL